MEAVAVVDGLATVEARVGTGGRALKPKVTPHPLVRTLTGILRHAAAGDGYDVWEKLAAVAGVGVLEEVLGGVPAKGIAHVGLDAAVAYACADADDTLALAVALDGLRHGLPEVAEGDIDHGRTSDTEVYIG